MATLGAPSLREVEADIERLLTIHRNRKRYQWDYYDLDHGRRPSEWHPESYHRQIAATKNARQRARRRAREMAS